MCDSVDLLNVCVYVLASLCVMSVVGNNLVWGRTVCMVRAEFVDVVREGGVDVGGYVNAVVAGRAVHIEDHLKHHPQSIVSSSIFRTVSSPISYPDPELSVRKIANNPTDIELHFNVRHLPTHQPIHPSTQNAHRRLTVESGKKKPSKGKNPKGQSVPGSGGKVPPKGQPVKEPTDKDSDLVDMANLLHPNLREPVKKVGYGIWNYIKHRSQDKDCSVIWVYLHAHKGKSTLVVCLFYFYLIRQIFRAVNWIFWKLLFLGMSCVLLFVVYSIPFDMSKHPKGKLGPNDKAKKVAKK
eukprot:GHVQ01016518.1.p1 GENE.GHVQ01016518.1~~GHVQ01016518.1.p1  ORF type:complete len:296 (+),score=36.58 GHVQ01016518.1:212-1099(+)